MNKKYLIAVGTTRKPKLDAVKKAMKNMPFFRGKTVQVSGYEVKSNVRHTPLSQQEIMRGAYHRAWMMIQEGIKADFYIGMEGGLKKETFRKSVFWMLHVAETHITDGHRESFSEGVSAEIPSSVANAVLRGKELSEVIDALQKKKDVRSKNGAIGEITWNIVKRSDAFYQSVVIVFAKFFHSIYKNTTLLLPLLS